MNPETPYTNKVRRLLKATYPNIVVVKHSDSFTGGIADIHASLPNAKTIWIEFKYLPAIARKRLGETTALQCEFLWDHFNVGVPSYVLIGTDHNKSHMLYRIDRYDGYAYRKDILDDKELMVAIEWTV